MLKNKAGQFLHVKAFNSSGLVSGDAGNITCELSIDGSSRAPITDTNPVEIGTTGEYVFTLTQAETNGYELSFTPKSSVTNVQVLAMPSNIIYTSIISQSSGPRSIELTFVDDDEKPIRNVIAILDEFDSQVSDTQGVLRFSARPGTFAIAIHPPYGLITPADLSVEVAGVDIEQEITLAPMSVPASTNPNACQCTLSVITAHNEPIDGALMVATTANSVVFADDALVFPTKSEATSDNGVLIIYLIQGVTYNATVSYKGQQIRFSIDVPESTTVSIPAIVIA